MQDLPWWFFWPIVLVIAGFAGAMLAMVLKARREIAAVAATPPIGVRHLSEGYRLVEGIVSGPVQVAPLTGRRCAWWALEVRKSIGSLRERRVRLEREEHAPQPFALSEGDAHCLVDPAVATLRWSSLSAWHQHVAEVEVGPRPVLPGDADVPNPVRDRMGWHFLERYIDLDVPVFVLGQVMRLPGAGPGRRLWAIGPAPGRPFVVATLPPAEFVATETAGARRGLFAGLLLEGVVLVLLFLRFTG